VIARILGKYLSVIAVLWFLNAIAVLLFLNGAIAFLGFMIERDRL
jgi:hypothetical protein